MLEPFVFFFFSFSYTRVFQALQQEAWQRANSIACRAHRIRENCTFYKGMGLHFRDSNFMKHFVCWFHFSFFFSFLFMTICSLVLLSLTSLQLLTGKYQPTQTSIVANKSALPLNGNKVGKATSLLC